MGFDFLSLLFGKKKGAEKIADTMVAGVNAIPRVELPTEKKKTKVDSGMLDSVKEEIKTTTENLNKLSTSFKDVETGFEKINSSVDRLEKQNEQINKKFDVIDMNMRKFLSLYEVINNQYNPFVTGDGKHPTPIMLSDQEAKLSESAQDNSSIFGDIKEEAVDTEESLTQEVSEVPKEDIKKDDKKNLPGFGPNFEYDANKAKDDLEKLKTQDKKMDENKPVIKERVVDGYEQNREVIRNTSTSDDDLAFFEFDTLDMQKAASDSVPLQKVKNDTNSLVVILSWLEYLVKRVGINSTRDTLRYYTETLSWITPEVFFELDKYLRGMNEMTNSQELKVINVRDHIVSLYFISKLNNKTLERRLVDAVLKIIKNQK